MVQYDFLDASFGALADPTRRGILECLGSGPATVSELAERFEMTLTGVKKHIQLLEAAGMVVTEKRGRVRHCRLGANVFDREVAWMQDYRRMVEARMDRLGEFLERTEQDR
ncbi:helix-turn-helix transcriptional regulator [Nocardia abscessus]|uniref:ArsR/SmtB family transcription factor n=1 Tax=Nocardia TaxID=1817 RepID=UPI0018957788|nr:MULTISPECIES: metalloregulator ArsR/SmtB family transcription factor [Nocardia]MBF6222979.1 helix-turn-helix transcriptional regulator [Nocardia abscessus]MDE1674410.1 metalloregulator ArsR/SmtB family transcription factor [Nocardia gipuzkoensis]